MKVFSKNVAFRLITFLPILLLLLLIGIYAMTAGAQSVTNTILYTDPVQIDTYLPHAVSLDETPVPSSLSTTEGWSVLAKPTITASFINQVLAFYGSPAQGEGENFYQFGVMYGIDPVYALAFFAHESHFGTTGVARYTKSIGNSRNYDSNKYCSTYGCYEKYNSWKEGIAEWYWQIQQYTNGKLYASLHPGNYKKLITVDQIIPVYAPSADHNNVAAYIAAIKHAVILWRSGKLAV